jgi:pimeloyl-ACP methyl ester carboxylesterase
LIILSEAERTGGVMATYVLVHGGWAGGWIFRDVAAYLSAAGHVVFRPTLTGVGERVHLATPEVGLNTNTLDIINLFRFEELSDVILVGYSLGGVIITNVADRIPDRISRLVYLDAFVPQDGQSLADILPDAMPTVLNIVNEYDGWRLPHDPPDAHGRTDQPFKIHMEPVRFRDPRALALPRTFVTFTKGKELQPPIDRSDPNTAIVACFLQAASVARSNPTWGYDEVACAHPFWEEGASEEIAKVLAELA